MIPDILWFHTPNVRIFVIYHVKSNTYLYFNILQTKQQITDDGNNENIETKQQNKHFLTDWSYNMPENEMSCVEKRNWNNNPDCVWIFESFSYGRWQKEALQEVGGVLLNSQSFINSYFSFFMFF